MEPRCTRPYEKSGLGFTAETDSLLEEAGFELRVPLLESLPRGTDGLHDSPLEEAVSSEPVSENRKFPASWENTGKFIDLGL
jgi:hypothetical protein